MTVDDTRELLRAYKSKRVRITFDGNVTQVVEIHSVDDKAVLHSGPDGIEPAHYWTRFESIINVESISPIP